VSLDDINGIRGLIKPTGKRVALANGPLWDVVIRPAGDDAFIETEKVNKNK